MSNPKATRRAGAATRRVGSKIREAIEFLVVHVFLMRHSVSRYLDSMSQPCFQKIINMDFKTETRDFSGTLGAKALIEVLLEP